MTTLTLELTDEQAQKWQQEAKRMRMSLEQFVIQSVAERLEGRKRYFEENTANPVFEAAMDYVFEKNSELYRRLA